MKKIYFMLLFLLGCSYVDGTYKTVSGSPLDYSSFNSFVEGQTTTTDATKALTNNPTNIVKNGNIEVFTYDYVREREAHTETLGIAHSKSVQRVLERISLTFENGILKKKDKVFLTE